MVSMLKKILKRELTSDQIKKAQEGYTSQDGTKILEVRTLNSHGSPYAHGPYIVDQTLIFSDKPNDYSGYSEERYYDLDGRLVHYCQYRSDKDGGPTLKHLLFNPPGSLVGKLVHRHNHWLFPDKYIPSRDLEHF